MMVSNVSQIISTLRQRRTLLLSLSFFAYVLRLFHLDTQSLWYDEGFSAWLSVQSLEQIVTRTAADIHPPLYYFLLHFWIALCGQSEFSLRFLSLIPAVLLIPVFFLLARRLFNETTGWIAAMLAAISPMYIWYAQEARMYALLTLLTLLSSYFFWRWLEQATWRWWLAFTLCNLLAVYLHFYGFFILAFQLIYFFIWWVRQETRWRILLAGLTSAAIVAAAYVPWARTAAQRLDADQSFFEGTLSLSEVLRKTFVMFSTGHSMLEGDAVPLASIFVVLAMFGWFVASRIRTDALKTHEDNPFSRTLTAAGAARLFLMLYGVTPFALLYFISYARPKFHPRYLLIASPPFLMLIAVGLAVLWLAFSRRKASMRRRYLTLAFVSALSIFVAFVSIEAVNNLYFDPRFSKDDFRGVANTIKANRNGDEPTLLVSGHMFPVYAYYDPQAQRIPLPDLPTLDTQRVLGYNVANDLNQSLHGKRGVWLVLWQNDVVDPSGFVTTILDTQAQRLPQPQSFYGVQLLHYQIPPGVVFSDQPQIQRTTHVNYGGQIELLGYNLPATASPADKGINIILYWRTLADLKNDYSVALRALDAEGHLVGKLDARPGNYNYPTTRWKNGDVLFGNFTIPLELGTPPGTYQIDVTLYTADNREGLDILDEAGNPKGKFTTLQSIPIERATLPPALDKLKPKHPLHFNFGGVLEMIGFDMDRDRAEVGEAINLTLYWRVLSIPREDYHVSFQNLRGSTGDDQLIPAGAIFDVVPGYPTSQWKPGEIIRGQYTYYLPTDTVAGDRALRMAVLDRNNRPVSAAVGLGDLHVEPSTRAFRPPLVRIVDVTRFADVIQLYGYDITPVPTLRSTVQGTTTIAAGDPLKVTLYWRLLQRVRTSYSVFVHLRADGPPIAQRDSTPVGGARPTTTWVPGEYITDSYELTVPRNTVPGTYFIEVGLYDSRTGERLPLQVSPSSAITLTAWRLGVTVTVR